MGNRERIAEYVRCFPGKDDDEISEALGIKPRQTVNHICRELAKAGMITRQPTFRGKLGNYPSEFPIAPAAAPSGKAPAAIVGDATQEWFWEGNVTDVVARYLSERGWVIQAQADTRTRERGPDLWASREDREILVEVKGYPSRSYRDPNRSDERKPTSPTLQAQHWYSQAILKAMRLQSAYPSALIALAFPDFPRYRTLFGETRHALQRLAVSVLFVAEDGEVDVIDL